MIELQDVQKRFVVRAKAGRLRRVSARGAGRRRDLVRDRARRDGRLRRPERRRQVDDDQDADRHPRADVGGESAVAGLDPHAAARSSSRGASASSSASARSSGGTCRWSSRSSCCATSTASPASASRRNLARFAELLELDAFLDTPVRQLSLGQRMRGELAAALLHDPADPLPRRADDRPRRGRQGSACASSSPEINRERGVTVLLTTHDLADIERLCSRLLIIDHGRLIYDGGLDELRAATAQERTLVVDLEERGAPRSTCPALACPGRRPAPVAALPARRDDRGRADRGRRGARPPPRPHDRGDRHRGDRPADLRSRSSSSRVLTTTSAGRRLEPGDRRAAQLTKATRASRAGLVRHDLVPSAGSAPRSGAKRRQGRMPRPTPTASMATSSGAPRRPGTKCWCISSEIA